MENSAKNPNLRSQLDDSFTTDQDQRQKIAKIVSDRVCERLGDALDRDLAYGLSERLLSNPAMPGLDASLSVEQQVSLLVRTILVLIERGPGQLSVKQSVETLEGIEGKVLFLVGGDQKYIVETLNSQAARLSIRFASFVGTVVSLGFSSEDQVCSVGLFDESKRRDLDQSHEWGRFFGVAHVMDPASLAALSLLCDSLEIGFKTLNLVARDEPTLFDQLQDVREECALNERRALPQTAEKWRGVRSFLAWLTDDNFLLMGYRKIRFDSKTLAPEIKKETTLGLCSDLSFQITGGQFRGDTLPPATHQFMSSPDVMRVFKANMRSPAIGNRHLDIISVKILSGSGDAKGVGSYQFVGLFNSSAYAERVQNLPYYQSKIGSVILRINHLNIPSVSRSLWTIADEYPLEEIWQASEDELEIAFRRILHLNVRRGAMVLGREDLNGGYISVMVYFPAQSYRPSLRQRMRDLIVQELKAEIRAESAQTTDDITWRFHFILRIEGELDPASLLKLERYIDDLGQSWSEVVLKDFDFQGGSLSRSMAGRLVRVAEETLPLTYREKRLPHAVLGCDLPLIVSAMRSGSLECRLNVDSSYDGKGDLEVVAIHVSHDPHHTPFHLSRTTEVFRDFGVDVGRVETYAFDATSWADQIVQEGSAESLYATLAVFRLDRHDPVSDEPEKRARIEVALASALRDEGRHDALSRMSWSLALSPREVMLWRAFGRYLRLLNVPLSKGFMSRVLSENPLLTSKLIDLFVARLDPDQQGIPDAQERMTLLSDEINELIAELPSIDVDRLYRGLSEMIHAVLRTNYFKCSDDSTPDALVFKFDTTQIDEAPQPRPLREIFVYSEEFEAVHLRGGLISRGGIRWSDRFEDFRTEILGLMKAQRVKNSVIVPTGCKGGFIVKKPHQDEQERRALGRESYEHFIDLMLSITDNIVDGEVVGAPGIICLDAHDPYLVVAADKGTATFSDYANAISERYGFWLGDAFASGGSIGYDHKVMGITARGAWKSVERHFFRLGINPQQDLITTVGVGDMSGDVFGNGMLLSRQIKLIGAFNHRHIFVDPDPDPQKTFMERKRLFEAGNLGWGDYDRSVISDGGDVFDRSAKNVTLSPQIQRILDLNQAVIKPHELIQRLLTSSVDLLWMGGIGAYIKAEDEDDSEIGDRGNDDVRVKASDVLARVIGEGANLGLTQRGRVEYCQNGGLCNTDAIDNVGGVNCSDLEVNIKILLNSAMNKGNLNADERPELLDSLQNDVAELVLINNAEQTASLASESSNAAILLERHRHIINDLERTGELDRKLEFLPSDRILQNRQRQGMGLLSPEIAVLMAYVKNNLKQWLLDEISEDQWWFVEQLSAYFPVPLSERYEELLLSHPLRREISVTRIVNAMVNHCGVGGSFELLHTTGTKVSALAQAYLMVRKVMDLPSIWALQNQREREMGVDASLLITRETQMTLFRSGGWLIRRFREDQFTEETTEHYVTLRQCIETALDDLLPSSLDERRLQRISVLERSGVDSDLARRVGNLKTLSSLFDIADLAQGDGTDFLDAARLYHHVGDTLRIDLMRTRANTLRSASDPWRTAALEQIINDYWLCQFKISHALIASSIDNKHSDWVDVWIARLEKHATFAKLQDLITEMLSTGDNLPLPMLVVYGAELNAFAQELPEDLRQ